MEHDVTVFKAYPFKVGQKIHIEGGARNGDWEVAGITENKVTLRCPVSHKEFSWAKFCYHSEDKKMPWPQED